MQKNLNQKIGQATKWSSITEIAVKLISPITNAVLARLLAPEMFGVVATLAMVTSFAEIFTDAGFQKYLVQHEFQDEKDLNVSTNVAFWTNFALSLVIWAVIACFVRPIANLVGSAGHETAIIVMSLEIPLMAFSSIQMARYRRDFNFKDLFAARMATALVPLVVTVPLALVVKNYWALVIGTLARDVLNAIILTVKSSWKPRLRYSFQKLKEMISFSAWSVVENVAIWITNYVGTFIVANALNDHYLGLYKTAMATVNSYLGLVTAATTPVLFSALSRCQDNNKEFKGVFFNFQRMVALLVFPLGIGLLVYRELVTLILLGDQWLEAANLVGLWSLTSAIAIIFSHYNSEVFRSKGKPKLSVLTQLLHIVVLVPVLVWSSDKGFAVLSASRALVRLELILASCLVARLAFGFRFVDALKNVWPSLVAALVMGAAGFGLRTLFDSVVWELFTVFLCVVVYAAVLLLLPAGRAQLAQVPVVNKLLHLKGKMPMADKKEEQE